MSDTYTADATPPAAVETVDVRQEGTWIVGELPSPSIPVVVASAQDVVVLPRGAVEELEWVWSGHDGESPQCPSCRADEWDGRKHHEGCPIATALGRETK